MTKLSSTEARKHWAELLNRVGYGKERITIERAGKPVATLVSEEEARLLEKIEDWIDIAEARKVLSEGNKSIPWDEVKRQLGL